MRRGATCPVAGCLRPRFATFFCCGPHWVQVPNELIDAINAAHEVGDARGVEIAELAALQHLNAQVPERLKVVRA